MTERAAVLGTILLILFIILMLKTFGPKYSHPRHPADCHKKHHSHRMVPIHQPQPHHYKYHY
jgi:hypothetical protein